jgi:hypothetical protein
MWKEAVVTYFKKLSKQLPGHTEDDNGEYPSAQLIAWSKL